MTIAHDTLAGHEIVADWEWHLHHQSLGGDDFQHTGRGFTMLSPCAGTVSHVEITVRGVDLNGIRVRHPSGYGVGVLELRRRIAASGQSVDVDAPLGEGGLVRDGETKCVHVHGYDKRGNRMRYREALARIVAWDEKQAREDAAELARILDRQRVIAAWSYLKDQPKWRRSAPPRGISKGRRSVAYIRMVQQAWRDRGHRDITVTGVFGRKTRHAEDFLARLGPVAHA